MLSLLYYTLIIAVQLYSLVIMHTNTNGELIATIIITAKYVVRKTVLKCQVQTDVTCILMSFIAITVY